MDNQRLEVGALLQRMWATVEASPSAVASFLVFVSACGFLVDIVLEETSAAGLLNSVVGFVASYFLMRALMGGSGLLPEGETGGFWAYFGVSFVAGLGIGLGFVLLVVPGVILLVRWSPALALVMSKD